MPRKPFIATNYGWMRRKKQDGPKKVVLGDICKINGY